MDELQALRQDKQLRDEVGEKASRSLRSGVLGQEQDRRFGAGDERGIRTGSSAQFCV